MFYATKYQTMLAIKTNKTMTAFMFAAHQHYGQIRKFSGEHYIVHPVAVANIVSGFQVKTIEKLVIASLLHDTVEDCPDCTLDIISNTFGNQVANLVAELTSDKEQIALLGKTEYMKAKMLSLSNQALLLKLADRLANMLDNPSDKMKKETLEIMLHLEANRALTFYQRVLFDRIISIVK